ncbi:MAG TPA: hypothetical protein VM509_02820 [Planctomycetota bacterium]|nr:hypothetical protein [Planctomycetota bacterium]
MKRFRCRALLSLVIAASGAPDFAQAQAPKAPPPAAALTDERLREAWSFLLPDEQEAAALYLADALQHLETFQQSLVAFALSLETRDPGQLPVAPPTPFYAPEIHSPRQPIERKRLDADDPRAVKQRAATFASVPSSGLDSAWRYDWATREVQRTKDDRDPTRLFQNALAGFPPDLDLGVALIERALDDGKEQASLAAFGHAYTDRTGTVYPGITLYDALSSGLEIEMPDVDVLGVIHELANDWKTWIAPVPDTRHDALYEKYGEFYAAAKHHRGLRTALAATFFSGSVALRDGYAGNRDRLHSWWDERSSMPEELAKELPESANWEKFLEQWSKRIDDDAALTQRGLVRRATLDADAARVRATTVLVLGDVGALERKARPKPPEVKQER